MNSSYLLLIFGAIACFVQSANSIRCYKCLPNPSDPECNNKHEVDCINYSAPQYVADAIRRAGSDRSNLKYDATGCLKKTYETYDGKMLVERGCYFGDYDNQAAGCIAVLQTGIRSQKSCDVCVTDRCNSSTTILPTAATLLLVLSMAFIGKLFVF